MGTDWPPLLDNPFDKVHLGAIFWSGDSQPDDVWNPGMECFDSCGMRERRESGVACPERCGPLGACCRQGVGNDTLCGAGSLGCQGHHCCHRAATTEAVGGAAEGEHFWVRGFFDGDATWRMRFMPPHQGVWQFRTSSTHEPLSRHGGQFSVIPPALGDRGPIHAAGHLFERVSDGESFFALGTTSYAWIQSTEELQRQTIATLRNSSFNKLRMAIFPEVREYNNDYPANGLYAYAGQPPIQCNWGGCKFDFRQFNPLFWRHLEARLDELQGLGIVAELILQHPYDLGWYDFDCMGGRSDGGYNLKHDLHYIRYAVARLASYANVWWSLANEHDLITCKTGWTWDVLGELLIEHVS